MPYLRCPRCGLSTFSAAYWVSVDRCGGCDAELPRPRRFVRTDELQRERELRTPAWIASP